AFSLSVGFFVAFPAGATMLPLEMCPGAPIYRRDSPNGEAPMVKRVFLFLATNLAVVVLLSLILNLLGGNRYLTANSIDVGTLLVFSRIVGFAGSIFSLLISKQVAKWSTGARVIDQPQGAHERWLVDTVRMLAQKAGVGMPEVAVYEGEPNAFATGA